MGQHYHVFFHKRRYSYGSPVCGCLSLIVYAALLTYIILKFKAVILKEDYTNLEEFKPISFDPALGVTVGRFFKTVNLEFVWDMVTNDSSTWYCPNYLDKASLIS